MVITIALLGTIAAIAYGLRASRLGSDNTLAIQVNRKVIESILQNIKNCNTSSAYFNQAGNPANDARSSTAWHPVYLVADTDDWFTLIDYGYKISDLTTPSPDCQRFMRDTRDYQLNVMLNPAVDNDAQPGVDPSKFSALRAFYEIVATTRWQEKGSGRWKWLETRTLGVPGDFRTTAATPTP